MPNCFFPFVLLVKGVQEITHSCQIGEEGDRKSRSCLLTRFSGFLVLFLVYTLGLRLLLNDPLGPVVMRSRALLVKPWAQPHGTLPIAN